LWESTVNQLEGNVMVERESDLSRRSFLGLTSRAAILLPGIGFAVTSFLACGRAGNSLAQPSAARNDSAPRSWKTSVVPDNEPGEPLVVSGTIYAPDGQTPLEGVTLWVYQTDATGHYSPLSESGGDNRNTRLHGLMRTNSDGRYEFRTIKPAPYPGRNNPAHIHAYVSGPGYPEYWIDEYLFEGDPYLTEEMKQKFGGKGSRSSILKLSRDNDGVWRAVRDIVIERCSKSCTGR
jgi:protocatechuate 3,4-dioxygenase, beta subunit